jgi:hypothetical protein
VKFSLLLDFNQIWNVVTNFSKTLQYTFYEYPLAVLELSHAGSLKNSQKWRSSQAHFTVPLQTFLERHDADISNSDTERQMKFPSLPAGGKIIPSDLSI